MMTDPRAGGLKPRWEVLEGAATVTFEDADISDDPGDVCLAWGLPAAFGGR